LGEYCPMQAAVRRTRDADLSGSFSIAIRFRSSDNSDRLKAPPCSGILGRLQR
jgi:hypothetical protein